MSFFFAVAFGVLHVDIDYPTVAFALYGFATMLGVGGGQLLIYMPKFVLVIKKKEIKVEDILVRAPISSRDRDSRGSSSVEMGNPMAGKRNSTVI